MKLNPLRALVELADDYTVRKEMKKALQFRGVLIQSNRPDELKAGGAVPNHFLSLDLK